MTERERFLKCLLGEDVNRSPFWLCWSPWATTWKRWQAEGCPFKSFGEVRAGFAAESPPQTVPVLYGPCPNYGWRTIEQTDEWYVFIDSWDIKRRNFKNRESMSEFLEWPVKSREDWERFKVERLNPDHPDRFNGDWLARAKDWMDRGLPIQMGCYPDVTLFGGVRWMLGDLECLLMFHDDPALIRDMMNHLTDLYLSVFRRIIDSGVRVDVIHIWEDMSGRQGSLISPAHFREFMTPNYARIRDFARRAGIPLMSVDTDGNPDLIVPPMMEGGINYLWPLEVAAGVDVNAFQRKYPSMGFMGGFDKRAAAAGPKAIDAEIRRIRPAVRRGRYIPDFDHLVPDDVSWENFRHYARAMKKLVGKA
jgi:uroporphyrinogen decarboxylase